MVELTRDPRTDRGERITYTSSDAFEFTQILDGSAKPQEIFGDLELPKGDGPFPCVVMCHGSYGWRSHHLDYADMFHEMGIATFRPHSFEARGTLEVSTTQIDVTMAMMICDAYAALALLADNPKIDAKRVAIAGWSLGGGMATYAAWLPIAEKLSENGRRFAAHMPVYPATHIKVEDNRWSNAPMCTLMGEAEDYTPAAPAVELTDDINAHGGNAEIILYPESYHSFDSTDELTFLPDVIALPPTRNITVTADGRMMTDKGVDVSSREARIEGFATMTKRGAHIGGNPAMREKAFADAKAFMTRTLL
ncbi:dienelactone hydrolase family protein [Pyruvatibacter sp. HU-CL02332]|uniref:dienelactone hydrolase family protein n=1 Tax=Pyruvatibacter sp. HU-CL02332 TaxID=3127650 RepID=UPI00310A9EAD